VTVHRIKTADQRTVFIFYHKILQQGMINVAEFPK